MISAKKYYEHIYERIICRNRAMFADCDAKNLEKIVIPMEKYSWLYVLLDQVEIRYGFNLQKMCAPNYNKFILWQNCFIKEQVPAALDAAMQFVIFCCLADKILDSCRFDNMQKEAVCEKLNIKNFLSVERFESNQFPEMDTLLNNIRVFLLSAENKLERDKIAVSIEKAFCSEIFMWKSPLQWKEEMERAKFYLLSDKSIQFELAAFLMASFGRNHDKSYKAALETANVFWLIDDLCDFIEDIKARRKNSILFYCVHTKGEVTLLERAEEAVKNVDEFVDLLEINLDLLRRNTDDVFFEYIVNEIWDWCTELRNMVE